MAQLTITINTDNDAFQDDLGYEVARILRGFADQIEQGSAPKRLFDINGNAVGLVSVEDDDE